MRLTKRACTVAEKTSPTVSLVEHDAMVSPSERWGLYRSGRYVTVFHVPTGLIARRGLTQRQGRNLIEAYEEIATPNLDVLGVGEVSSAPEAKEELVLLLKKINDLLHEGLIG